MLCGRSALSLDLGCLCASALGRLMPHASALGLITGAIGGTISRPGGGGGGGNRRRRPRPAGFLRMSACVPSAVSMCSCVSLSFSRPVTSFSDTTVRLGRGMSAL